MSDVTTSLSNLDLNLNEVMDPVWDMVDSVSNLAKTCKMNHKHCATKSDIFPVLAEWNENITNKLINANKKVESVKSAFRTVTARNAELEVAEEKDARVFNSKELVDLRASFEEFKRKSDKEHGDVKLELNDVKSELNDVKLSNDKLNEINFQIRDVLVNQLNRNIERAQEDNIRNTERISEDRYLINNLLKLNVV